MFCFLLSLFLCALYSLIFLFFFFHAEDGIRDLYVTGVQTCALPICGTIPPRETSHLRREGVRANERASRRRDHRRVPRGPAACSQGGQDRHPPGGMPTLRGGR